MTCEAFFYHIEGILPLKILPLLLEKSFQQSWINLVVTSDISIAQDLDQWLWVYKDVSFLPHKIAQDSITPALQKNYPILITSDDSWQEIPLEWDGIFYFECLPRTHGQSQLRLDLIRKRLIFIFRQWHVGIIQQADALQKQGCLLHCWQYNAENMWVQAPFEDLQQHHEIVQLEELE